MEKKKAGKRPGSAIILTLMVVLLLSLLGIAALGMSLGNVKMSQKVEGSSEAYYNMDAVAEDILGDIDLQLKTMEDAAIRYLRYELFSSEKITANEVQTLDNEMVEILYKNSSAEGIRKKAFEVSAYLNPEVHAFFYKEWQKNVYEPSKLGNSMNYNQYNQKMDSYYEEAFNRIYMYHVENLLKDYQGEKLVKGEKVKYRVALVKDKKKDYTLIGSASPWERYSYNRGDCSIEIDIEGKDRKHLAIELAVTPPLYASVSQIETSAIFGSRAITNAIYAKDMAIQGEKIHIAGDIVLQDNLLVEQIKSFDLYGNLFLGNQMIVKESSQGNKAFRIHPYKEKQGYRQAYKESLFQAGVFADLSASSLKNYKEEQAEDYKSRPILIFKDSPGGNLMTKHLQVSRDTSHFNLEIGGHALIRDNVVLEAKGESQIDFKGHLVMTRPYSNEQEQGSVCYLTQKSNQIGLNGLVVIPGYYRGYVDERQHDFSQCRLESIKRLDGIKALASSWIDQHYLYLQTMSNDIDKKYEVGLYRAGSERDIYGFSNSPIILRQDNGVHYFLPEGDYMFNNSWMKPRRMYMLFKEYEEAIKTQKDQWQAYWDTKTRGNGFTDLDMEKAFDISALKDIKGYLSEKDTGVKVLSAGSTLHLDEDFEGIVYGLGDLTIKGNHKIKGSVVVKGKLIVQGSPEIEYNEGILLDLQRKNKWTQSFLKPSLGSVPIDYSKKDTLSPKVRSVTDGDRFKVNVWKIE